MAVPVPQGRWQFSTSTGVAAGYRLYIYNAGTTNFVTTWQDALQQSLNPNPIILDVNGSCSLFCSGSIKLVLASPTDTSPPTSPIWSVDNIRLPAATTVTDSNGLTIGVFNGVTNAVNYIQLNNAATGDSPSIQVEGSDASPGFNILSKAGTIVGAYNPSSNAVNYLTISNSATGSSPTLSPDGTDTNIGLNLTPKGSGVITINGGENITGSLTIGTNLNVTGNATVTGNVTVMGSLSGGTYSPTNIILPGYLTVAGTTSLAGGVSLTAGITIGTSATIGTTLGVTGTSTLAGLTATTGSFSSTLAVTGTTTLTGGISGSSVPITLTSGQTVAVNYSDTRTNTTVSPLTVNAATSGIPATNLGVGILFTGDTNTSSAPVFANLGQCGFYLTSATTSTAASNFVIQTRVGGNALANSYIFQNLGTSGSYILTGTPTAARTLTLPDASVGIALGTGFQVTLSGNQTIAVATLTKITFNTIGLDVSVANTGTGAGNFSTSTNTYTIPVAGIWCFAINLQMSAQAAMTLQAELFKNGSAINVTNTIVTAAGAPTLVVHAFSSCAVGDTITVEAIFGSANASNAILAAATQTNFSGFLLK